MAEYHRLLKRQLKRYLREDAPREPELEQLLAEISEAYENYDKQASILQRAIEMNSQELNEANRKIGAHLEEVEDLKQQQDGDYFLTSLLLKPLSRNNAHSPVLRIDTHVEQLKRFSYRKWQFEIGGDVCTTHNVRLQNRDYVAILNGDAMGKSMQGAGGALVMGSVFQSVITRSNKVKRLKEQPPEAWLRIVYQELHEIFQAFDGSMLIAGIAALVDETTGLLYYIKAEHPEIVLYRNGKARFVHNEMALERIGLPGSPDYIEVRTVQMQTGDVLFIGSDGRDDILLLDRDRRAYDMNQDPELFLRIVEETSGLMKPVVRRIHELGETTDDLSLVRLEYRGRPPILHAKPDPDIAAMISSVRESISSGEMELARRALLDHDPKKVTMPAQLKEMMGLALDVAAEDFAISCGEEYIHWNPGDSEFLVQFTRVLEESGDRKGALELRDRLHLRDPEDVQNMEEVLRLCIETARLEKAERVARQILEANPDHSRARAFLSSQAETRGDS